MAKKIPIRRCIGCGGKKPKRDLIRIVYNKSTDQLIIDSTGKLPGRGAYICPNRDCLEKVKKAKKLNRALKIPVSDKVYNKLMEEIDR